MTQYLFIDSRDPFDSRDTEFVISTASALRRRGHEVTVFLVQNGVLGARRQARDGYVATIAATGARVLADAFSLRERGIADDELHPSITPSGVDVVVEMLSSGAKTIWH